MPRIDIARLRKERGMSQSDLAHQLQITQSFLSAIENGKSPLPPEKEMRIMEIFKLDDLNEYLIDAPVSNTGAPAKSLEDYSDGDIFNQLLNRFHNQAHRNDSSDEHHKSHHERIELLEERNDRLMMRNDALFERNEALYSRNMALSEEIESLRAEIYKLKEQLLSK